MQPLRKKTVVVPQHIIDHYNDQHFNNIEAMTIVVLDMITITDEILYEAMVEALNQPQENK